MLNGCAVLDCTDRLGWLAGRLLADMGADVLKLESPEAQLDGSDWRALNVNKRLQRLDLHEPAYQEEFDKLVAGADILLATFSPGGAQASLFDFKRLAAINSRLIVVAITPFGLAGPDAAWFATDIEIMAAGGAMSLAGEPDGEPLRISVPQSYPWAGSQAAVGALTALAARAQSGRGQLVDVSAQAAVVVALAHAPTFFDIEGVSPTRAGAFMTGRSVKGARFRVFWPCRDGHINFILYGGAAGRRTFEQLVAWMRSAGAALGPLADIDCSKWDPTRASQAEVDALDAPIAEFFASLTKREFLEEAHRREMLGYPVSSVADTSNDAQVQARGFWQEITAPGGEIERHCGCFVIVDRKRPAIAIPDGQWAGHRSARSALAGKTAPQLTRPPAATSALDGLKIVEFGSYAAGPHIGKMLANFGAVTVHVESHSRPDGFRLQYPPYRGGRPDINNGGCFAYFNDSKFGVTLELKKAAGLELARRLALWSDVVIENMRPGVIDRLGLGYESLSKEKPSLVMLSTCNMGQTGPRADTPGFGSQLTALVGMCGLTGYPGGSPMLLYGPYVDFIASTMGASAVLAALERRRVTGKGAYLDVSQYESGLMFLAGALLDYHRRGTIAGRTGNDDAGASPHGAYQCADGNWLVLSCWTDAHFSQLCAAIGRPDLAADARLATLAGRKSNREAIEPAIAAWAIGLGAQAGAAILQHAQIPAHAVNSMADLFVDPQLAARRQWRTRPHPVIGEQRYCMPAFDLSATPGDISSAAPVLGGDNQRVFCELLGLGAQEYERFRAMGAMD